MAGLDEELRAKKLLMKNESHTGASFSQNNKGENVPKNKESAEAMEIIAGADGSVYKAAQCWNCGKHGHVKKNCSFMKKNGKKKRKKNEGNDEEEGEEEGSNHVQWGGDSDDYEDEYYDDDGELAGVNHVMIGLGGNASQSLATSPTAVNA